MVIMIDYGFLSVTCNVWRTRTMDTPNKNCENLSEHWCRLQLVITASWTIDKLTQPQYFFCNHPPTTIGRLTECSLKHRTRRVVYIPPLLLFCCPWASVKGKVDGSPSTTKDRGLDTFTGMWYVKTSNTCNVPGSKWFVKGSFFT